jgi:hypothetical protein
MAGSAIAWRRWAGSPRAESGSAPSDARCAGLLLAVEHAHALAAQEGDQVGQRHLGGVRDAREHRFAVEHAADADAIGAADQFAVQPDFRRVRIAHAGAAAIAGDDVFRDPGAGAVLARRGAGAHHGFEGAVEAHHPGAVLEARALDLAQGLLEAVADLEAVGVQHHARIGAPPQDGLAFGEPGEDAVAVGLQQALRRQVGAGGKQAGRSGQRLGHIGEGRIDIQPGNHAQFRLRSFSQAVPAAPCVCGYRRCAVRTRRRRS